MTQSHPAPSERERCKLCGSTECGCVLGRPPEPGRVDCMTLDCRNRAVVYLTCEGEGAHPYCDDCAQVLRRSGETEAGQVDDPVVAENLRLRDALEQLRHLVVSPGDMGREEIRDAGRRVIEEALDA